MRNKNIEAMKSLLFQEIRKPDREFTYFLDEYVAGLNLGLSKGDARIKAFEVTAQRFPKWIKINGEKLGELKP